MNKRQANIWLLATVIFAVCLTVFALHHFVTDPWHIVGELGGDGAKNNFTFLYESMYGKGLWFTGMNYPYGEHIVFTDAQPVLSVLLSHVKNMDASRALTIMWRLIGLSYVLSIIFIYKLLTNFRVAPLLAMLFAGLITIFSPQLLRIQGHYALAYVCVIPMVFYWLVQYQKGASLKYCVYLFILGTVAAFMHLYYIAMMLVWVIGYIVAYFIIAKAGLQQKVKHVVPPVLSVVAIFALVSVVMKLTDPITDRPVSPYNSFYDTCTRLRQIVTSTYSPIWPFLKSKHLIYFLADGGEGYVYLGLVICFTLFIAGILAIIRSVKEGRLSILTGDAGFSPIWLIIGFFALMIGMGIPFIWHAQWLDYLAVFRQFRSLGRFSWIFYHIAAVYCVVVIYQGYKSLVHAGRSVVALVLVAGAIMLWGFEAKGYIDFSRSRSDNAMYNFAMLFSENEQNWNQYLEQHHYNRHDFQAVLSLPFYNVGTEKLWVSGRTDWLNTLSTKAALQLQLPIVDMMLSRSSWSQAFGQVRIAGGPYSDKPLLRDIPNRKPFIVLCFDEDTLSPDQQYLLQAGDYIGHYSQCNVYAVYPDRIAANDKKNADNINQVLPVMHGADTCLNNSNGATWYVDHFNGRGEDGTLFGKIYGYENKDSTIMAAIPIKMACDSMLYELSCWFLVGKENYRTPDMLLCSVNAGGRQIDTTFVHTNKSTDNYGMWLRMSKYLYLNKNVRLLRCVLLNSPKPSYKAMDEVMLRPADATIISKGADGKVMVNNHLFKNK